MTKVEIDGKIYCVETLIYEVERLKKDVKASAEYHRLILEQIRDGIAQLNSDMNVDLYNKAINDVLQFIDIYIRRE